MRACVGAQASSLPACACTCTHSHIPLQAELQQHLESRGLDKDGNKEELANRLLDNMIAQVGA